MSGYVVFSTHHRICFLVCQLWFHFMLSHGVCMLWSCVGNIAVGSESVCDIDRDEQILNFQDSFRGGSRTLSYVFLQNPE